MIIGRTSKEVIFRLPSSTKLEDLQDIADLFAFKELLRNLKATQTEVDDLLKKLKKAAGIERKRNLGYEGCS